MKVSNNLDKGFTLIELMIVVAIIGILAAIAIPQYESYTLSAHATKMVQAVGHIKRTLEMAYNDGSLRILPNGYVYSSSLKEVIDQSLYNEGGAAPGSANMTLRITSGVSGGGNEAGFIMLMMWGISEKLELNAAPYVEAGTLKLKVGGTCVNEKLCKGLEQSP